MAGFLYYIPGQGRAIGHAELIARGLGYALQDGYETPCEIHNQHGPDAGNGVIVADPRRVPDGRIRLRTEEQIWRQAPGGKYWVGLYTAERPTPAELRRFDALPGSAVTLGDGQAWEIPLARAVADHQDEFIAFNALPQQMELNERGEWQPGDTVPRAAALWDLAVKYWDAKMAAQVQAVQSDTGRAVIEFADHNDAAVQVLASNYVIDKVEVVLLGLFVWNGPQTWAVLNALVDWDAALEWLKKKQERDGTATADGPPAATAGTAPPWPTSGCSVRDDGEGANADPQITQIAQKKRDRSAASAASADDSSLITDH